MKTFQIFAVLETNRNSIAEFSELVAVQMTTVLHVKYVV